MRDYRFYCLDEAGRVESAEWLRAQSDDEAILLAQALKKPGNCEVWLEDRLVAQVPPLPAGDSANERQSAG